MDVKILEKTKDGLHVAVLPHNIPAFLPTPHLSDHVTNGPLLYHWLQAGDTLHRVLCLSQSEKQVVSLISICGAEKAGDHGPLWWCGGSVSNSAFSRRQHGENISHLTTEIPPQEQASD